MGLQSCRRAERLFHTMFPLFLVLYRCLLAYRTHMRRLQYSHSLRTSSTPSSHVVLTRSDRNLLMWDHSYRGGWGRAGRCLRSFPSGSSPSTGCIDVDSRGMDRRSWIVQMWVGEPS